MTGRLRVSALVVFILSWVYVGAQVVYIVAGLINADSEYFDGGDKAEFVLQHLAEGVALFTLLFGIAALLRHLADRQPSPALPPAPPTPS